MKEVNFKRKTIALGVSLAISAHSNANEILGIRVGLAYWSPEISGPIISEDLTASDASVLPGATLSVGMDETAQRYYFELRHDIPVIPRFRYESLSLSATRDFTTSRDINFISETFAADSVINESIDLSYTDIKLYYTLLDSNLGFEVGLNNRSFKGEYALETPSTDTGGGDGTGDGGTGDDGTGDGGTVDDGTGDGGTGDDGTGGDGTAGTDTGDTSATNLTRTSLAIAPTALQAFVQSRFKYPEVPLHFILGYQSTIDDKNQVRDIDAKLSLVSHDEFITVRWEIGYKEIKMKLKKLEGADLDLKVSGPYIGIEVGF